MSEVLSSNPRLTNRDRSTVTDLFAVCLQSGKNAAREALHQVTDRLSPLALSAEELSTVELVLAEALNNIVEHAYPPDASEGPIEVRCSHQRDGLHFALIDEGHPMPDGQAPIGLLPDHEVDIEDLPEGGFGWFLIQDLAKDVVYQRFENKNELRLRVAVAYGQP